MVKLKHKCYKQLFFVFIIIFNFHRLDEIGKCNFHEHNNIHILSFCKKIEWSKERCLTNTVITNINNMRHFSPGRCIAQKQPPFSPYRQAKILDRKDWIVNFSSCQYTYCQKLTCFVCAGCFTSRMWQIKHGILQRWTKINMYDKNPTNKWWSQNNV